MSQLSADPQYEAIRGGVGLSMADELAVLRVRGERSGAFLDSILTGRVERLGDGTILWTAILDEDGAVAADVQVYNDCGDYLVTCDRTCLRTVKDVFASTAEAAVEVEDLTENLGVVAIEGPDALELPEAVLGPSASGLPPLRFTHCDLDGADVLVARIGYSGEFSYLLFAQRTTAAALYDGVRHAAPDAVPCERSVQGLLKLEMRLPDTARDFPRRETALQAGLHWMIDFRKPDFRGRAAVMAEKESGVARRMVCFVAESDTRVDPGAALFLGQTEVGYVANTAWSPGLSRPVGAAYVHTDYAWSGLSLQLADGSAVRLVSAPMLVPESGRRTVP